MKKTGGAMRGDGDGRLPEGMRRHVDAARRDVLPPERVEGVLRRVVAVPPPPRGGGSLGGAGIGNAGLAFLAGVAAIGGGLWFGFGHDGHDGHGGRGERMEPPQERPGREAPLGAGASVHKLGSAPRLQHEERGRADRSRDDGVEGGVSGLGAAVTSEPAAHARGEDDVPASARPSPRAAGERQGRPAMGHVASRARERALGSGEGVGSSPEYELLLRARMALRQRHPAEALRWLRAHRRRHPRGLLRLEREVMRVEALAALGREREARRLAARLQSEPGVESYRHRLQRVLGGTKQR